MQHHRSIITQIVTERNVWFKYKQFLECNKWRADRKHVLVQTWSLIKYWAVDDINTNTLHYLLIMQILNQYKAKKKHEISVFWAIRGSGHLVKYESLITIQERQKTCRQQQL